MPNTSSKDQQTKTSPETGGTPHVRADAQRSIDALLAAAQELFATTGVEATTREIAERAGVGMGTLFRRFPQRADLIIAVYQDELDACAQAATTLAAECQPFEAFANWMRLYVQFVRTKRGLAKALSCGDSVYDGLFTHFFERLHPVIEQLYERGAATGELPPDFDVVEILCAATTLCMSPYDQRPDHADQMVGLLVQGLRLPH